MGKQILYTALIVVLLFGLYPGQVSAQEKEDHSYKPLIIKLDESGQKYVRFIMWHQIWATTNNLNTETKLQITPSIRRSRFLAFAQVSPKFLILTHFGLNGLTPSNLTSLGNNGDSPQLFLHGAWTEFKINKSLYMGGGLHYWKGLTRLSNQSTLNFMTLDQSRPFVHWHSLGITDQFARHIGLYAKGSLGRIDYRLAWNAPSRNPLGNGKDYGLNNSNLTYTGASTPDEEGNVTGGNIIEGYFTYSFFDKESTKLPYYVGTYLGKKKVFNLGAGFFTHPKGMFNNSTGTHESVAHFAADAFLDLPTKSGGLTAYASFSSFNYGNNYVSRWAGTGSVIYTHLGYFIKSARIMPYLAFQSASYEGLPDHQPSAMDVGLNYYILGHNAKLTLEYHKISNDPRETTSQLRLQAHIFL